MTDFTYSENDVIRFIDTGRVGRVIDREVLDIVNWHNKPPTVRSKPHYKVWCDMPDGRAYVTWWPQSGVIRA